ncbi:GTP pyrophosphokinase [Clostridia bacterium]|nr:GTP pyrophosphokinase [Clostridia bacterium]
MGDTVEELKNKKMDIKNVKDTLINKPTYAGQSDITPEEIAIMRRKEENTLIYEKLTSEQTDITTLQNIFFELILSYDKYDFSKIELAYRFAKEAHDGVIRKSGQPYIAHPLSVAIILIKELKMDTDTICGALLHDVIEDTEFKFEDVKRNFGIDVANLVDGVTKISRLPFMEKSEVKAESTRKLFLAISKDVRVLFIKVADRLHNIRTLKFFKPDKQRRIATETMYVYASLADRLGMHAIKEELEDLSLQYLDPYAYREIEDFLILKKTEGEDLIKKIKNEIKKQFKPKDFVQEPFVEGRVKSVYGIYRKAFKENKSFEEIFDKYAVRVIVSNKGECYNVLGLIHDLYTPIQGNDNGSRFKDYISRPKKNGYQSLHTTVIGKEGIPFEVQIRTWAMHETAEYGVAAHWKYKAGLFSKDKADEYLSFIRQALDIQLESDGAEDLIDIIRKDYTSDSIMVITPKSDTITLPTGSTALDFAYRIHTNVGHRAVGVKIDKKIQKLDTVLKDGQIIEMILGKDLNPNRNWLSFVRTSEAKSKIRAYFKNEQRSENIAFGKSKLQKEFAGANMVIPDKDLTEFLSSDMRKHNCLTLDDFYASIGYGGVVIENLMPKLENEYRKKYLDAQEYYQSQLRAPKKIGKTSEISLGEISTLETKFAKCCNPLPGDSIVGFVTRLGYITVHRDDCLNFLNSVKEPENAERWHRIDWQKTNKANHEVRLSIIALDRIGLNLDITMVLAESKMNIIQSSSRNLKNGQAIFEANMLISSVDQLNILIAKLKTIRDVISVERS